MTSEPHEQQRVQEYAGSAAADVCYYNPLTIDQAIGKPFQTPPHSGGLGLGHIAGRYQHHGPLDPADLDSATSQTTTVREHQISGESSASSHGSLPTSGSSSSTRPVGMGLTSNPSLLLPPVTPDRGLNSPPGLLSTRFPAMSPCLTDALSALRSASMVRSGTATGCLPFFSTPPSIPSHVASSQGLTTGSASSIPGAALAHNHHHVNNDTSSIRSSRVIDVANGDHVAGNGLKTNELASPLPSHLLAATSTDNPGGSNSLTANNPILGRPGVATPLSLNHHQIVNGNNIEVINDPGLSSSSHRNAHHNPLSLNHASFQHQINTVGLNSMSNLHNGYHHLIQQQQHPGDSTVDREHISRMEISSAEKIISEIVGQMRQEAASVNSSNNSLGNFMGGNVKSEQADNAVAAYAGKIGGTSHLYPLNLAGVSSGSRSSSMVRMPTTFCTPGASTPLSKMGRKRGRPSRDASPGAKPFGCSFCQKGFYQKNQLLQHERIHTDERPYPCTYCDRRFKQQSHKMQHERIHTGEKPYHCPTCARTFRQKNHLDSHYRGHFMAASQHHHPSHSGLSPSMVVKREPMTPPPPASANPGPPPDELAEALVNGVLEHPPVPLSKEEHGDSH